MAKVAKTRPRIACFHGGGSNAEIFSVQCQMLDSYIGDMFELVFFDAPFVCGAGPGVLPAFESSLYSPYRSWFSYPTGFEFPRDWGNLKGVVGSGRGDGRRDDGDEGGVERVLRLMLKEGEGGDWVGAMGFSQGTRVVGGLLGEQMRLRRLGLPGLANGAIDLKFGILCMGGAAPMLSLLSPEDGKDDVGIEKINIPTLHLHGLRDANLENGRKQIKMYFEENSTTLVEIDYHHAMPWKAQDLLNFSTAIKKLHASTQQRA